MEGLKGKVMKASREEKVFPSFKSVLTVQNKHVTCVIFHLRFRDFVLFNNLLENGQMTSHYYSFILSRNSKPSKIYIQNYSIESYSLL